MIFRCLSNGIFGSNCYIIGDSKDGILIDAGVDTDEVLKAVDEMKLNIKYIILTHAHIDHVYYKDEIAKRTSAKVLIHQEDALLLCDNKNNGLPFLRDKLELAPADAVLNDGDIIEVGDLKFAIIHTPGHTQGCICVKVNDILLTGDTLFKLSVGRTDMYGGSFEKIISSIRNKLMVFGSETIVYPGHGDSTTIGYEKSKNPFLSGYNPL